MSDLLTKCTVCQAILDEEDLFCANCGTEAPDRGDREAAQTKIATHNFECQGCGASMSYDASAQTLRCPFCGSEKLEEQKDQKDQQDQKQDQQKQDEQSKKDQQKQDEQKNQQEAKDKKEQEKKDRQQAKAGDKSKDKQVDPQQVGAHQMTPQEAKQLLDAQKDDEQVLIFQPQGEPKNKTKPLKDW